jgi:hypothetical protein
MFIIFMTLRTVLSLFPPSSREALSLSYLPLSHIVPLLSFSLSLSLFPMYARRYDIYIIAEISSICRAAGFIEIRGEEFVCFFLNSS